MGLGVENWSVEQCINTFTGLCGQAFTPREFINIPVIGLLTTANHGSRYKTKPLEAALQASFQDRPLFGGSSQEGHMIKVAVTSTTVLDQQPIVLANYNRPDQRDPRDYRELNILF